MKICRVPREGQSDGLNFTIQVVLVLVLLHSDGLNFTVQLVLGTWYFVQLVLAGWVMMGEDISRRHGGNRTIAAADRPEKRGREEDEEREERERMEFRENRKIHRMTKGMMGEVGISGRH